MLSTSHVLPRCLTFPMPMEVMMLHSQWSKPSGAE